MFLLDRAKSGRPFEARFPSDDSRFREKIRNFRNRPRRRPGLGGGGAEGDRWPVALCGNNFEQHEEEGKTKSGSKIFPVGGKSFCQFVISQTFFG